jgi:hypothetical protein
MISEGGQRVRWSDAAEAGQIPPEWTPSQSNFAGFLDLAPMSSDCVDGRTGRNAFLIYKRESIWSLSFVGGNAVFQARKMFSEAGCAATNAVTSGPSDEHVFIGSDGDIHVTDGVTVQSVLDGRAQRFFYADFSNSAGGVFSCAGLSREKLAVLCFPASGATAGTRALLFDFASGDISFRDMPEVLCMAEGRFLEDVGDANIWDGDAEVWNDDATAWNRFISGASVQDIVMGTATEQMLFWGGRDTLPVRLEKSGLAFGNPQSHKMIARVWPKIRGRKGDVVTFRLGGQSVAGGPVSLADPVDFVIGSGQPIDAFQQGRFLTLIAESTPAVQPWSLASIDIEFRELGKW